MIAPVLITILLAAISLPVASSTNAQLAVEMLFARPVFGQHNPSGNFTYSVTRPNPNFTLRFCLPAGRMLTLDPNSNNKFVVYTLGGASRQNMIVNVNRLDQVPTGAFPSTMGEVIGYGGRTLNPTFPINMVNLMFRKRSSDGTVIMFTEEITWTGAFPYTQQNGWWAMAGLWGWAYMPADCQRMMDQAKAQLLQPVYEVIDAQGVASYTDNPSVLTANGTAAQTNTSPRVAFCALRDGVRTGIADFDAQLRPLSGLNNTEIFRYGRVDPVSRQSFIFYTDQANRQSLASRFPRPRFLSVMGQVIVPSRDLLRGSSIPVYAATYTDPLDDVPRQVYYYAHGDDIQTRYGKPITDRWTVNGVAFHAWPRELCM